MIDTVVGPEQASSNYYEAVKHLNECKKLQGRLSNAKTHQTEAKLEESLERRAEMASAELSSMNAKELSCLNYVMSTGSHCEVDLQQLSVDVVINKNKHRNTKIEKWNTVTVDEMNKANAINEQEQQINTMSEEEKSKKIKIMLKRLKK